MSADEIYMDYSSVLGPIDPQVQNKDGQWVAALGYLDKVDELIEKDRNNTLTKAEFSLLNKLDLATLRQHEQARDLTTSLLKAWLVKYKFKDWETHGTTPELLGQPVTEQQKEERAADIAVALSNNKQWHSHGRPINIFALHELKLKVNNFGDDNDLQNLIRSYHGLTQDYIQDFQIPIFAHTRNFL